MARTSTLAAGPDTTAGHPSREWRTVCLVRRWSQRNPRYSRPLGDSIRGYVTQGSRLEDSSTRHHAAHSMAPRPRSPGPLVLSPARCSPTPHVLRAHRRQTHAHNCFPAQETRLDREHEAQMLHKAANTARARGEDGLAETLYLKAASVFHTMVRSWPLHGPGEIRAVNNRQHEPRFGA